MNMINLKPYQQKSAGFCGPVCLKMVMDFYGVFIPEEKINKAVGAIFDRKISGKKMVEAAKSFGFNVYSKEKATIKDLERFVEEGKPVIVRWFLADAEPDGHYSVVVDINEREIILADPIIKKILIYTRRRRMSIRNFLKVWFDYKGEYLNRPEDMIIRLMLVLVPKDKKISIKKSLGLKKER